MPERVVKRRRTRLRVAVLCAAFGAVMLLSAAFSGLPALARLKGEVQVLRGKYFHGAAEVKGAQDSESAIGAGWVSGAEDLEYLDSEREWLRQSQLPCGAIAQTPRKELVVPYFANLAAKTLVDIDPSRAKAYITWYLENMNKPDRNGLSGTIYDYEVVDDELVPTYKYDSADSYAATFLSLVSYYFHRTGDLELVTSNLTAIDLAAQAILALQDTDGLIKVMPGTRTKYLMDNSECYRGLLDWASVLDRMGEETQAAVYIGVAERVAEAINTVLYDAERDAYAWSLNWYGKRFPKEGKWYPDAVSQTDLITYGVIAPTSEKARSIWSKFNEQFPSWDQGVNGDRFPWAKIAVTATIMQDTPRAERFVTWVRDEYSYSGRPYPWYVMESASTLEAVAALLTKRP